MGFVMQKGARAMNASRYAVLRHLERVRHHVALEIEPTSAAAFARWARASNAIVFHEDARVTDPDGAVLVDPATGDAAPGAVVPHPADAVARRDRTRALLDERGIVALKSLPPVVSAIEVELRAPADVARRAIALFGCALRAESLAGGEPIPTSEIDARIPLVRAALSPAERTFFDSASPDRQSVVNHVWRYESLAVLLWALGDFDALPFPTTIADVPGIAQRMLGTNGAERIEGAG